jgi:uroporphyrinogen-III decarboxylase
VSLSITALREGLRRMQSARSGKPDRVPVYAQISHHSARLRDESTYRFFTDARTFLDCELYADEFYGIDAPTIHYDCYNIEVEAMGVELVFAENEYPAVDPLHPLLRRARHHTEIGGVHMGRSGRMPYVLEINRRLMDLGLAPKIRFCGIFTMAAKLLGYERLIEEIVSRPDDVHRMMEFLTDEIVGPWIQCQRDSCGVDATATGSEALASPPLLSLDLIEEYCLLYARRLEGLVGGVRLAGLWGEHLVDDPERYLDMKREFSQDMLQVCDPDASSLGPEYFRRYADAYGQGLIMGLDAGLIRRGPESAIRDRARRFIDGAGRDGRFVLFINDVPYDTQPDHVRAAVAVAHQYIYS